MNIPNCITIFRFVLIPMFFYVFYVIGDLNFAVLIFICAGITDVLDGYLARKLNEITTLGKLLDPLADKLMQISVLFVLTQRTLIPIWIIVVMILKEMFLIIGSGFLYRKNVVVEANRYGKLATVLFYVSIVTVFLIDDVYGSYLLITTVFLMLYVAFRYFYQYLRVAKDVDK